MSWNANTHIMETINIGWGDISQALGVPGPPFSMGDMVVAAMSINKWAKYKFIRSGTIDFSHQLNNDKTAWAANADWWKGGDGHCGMDIQEFTAIGEMSNANSFRYKLAHGLLPWNYLKPTGTALSPFRPLDLFKYYSEAEPVVADDDITDIWLDMFGNFLLSYDTAADNSLALSVSDLGLGGHPITDFYIGVLLFNDSVSHFITSDQKITAGSSITISFSNASSLAGVWNIVPFLSSVQYALGDIEQQGVYASCFDILPKRVVIHAAGTTVLFLVEATWNAAHTAVDCSVEVENQGSNNYTINLELDMRQTDILDVDPATGDKITTPSIGAITVAAGQTRIVTGSFAVSGYDQSKFYFIKGYADGFGGSQYNQVEEYTTPPGPVS